MPTLYQLDKYQPPKNQAPSKVRRFPLYRRPAPKPAPAAPPAKDPPKEETPAPPPSTWSEWQLIKEPQWEGYWRASAQEDGELCPTSLAQVRPQALTVNPGGWHYHFTKDGKTIWEQKVPKTEAPIAATASAKTDGERVLFGQIPATAFTTAQAPSSRPTSTAGDGVSHTSLNGTSLSALSRDVRSLTLSGHSTSEAYATVRAQAASSSNPSRQSRSPQRQDRGDGTSNRASASASQSTGNHRDNHRNYSIVYSEEARASQTTGAVQEDRRDYHTSHKKRQGRHGAHTRSREAGGHQNTLGEIISAEKEKRFDAKKVVDNWQWG